VDDGRRFVQGRYGTSFGIDILDEGLGIALVRGGFGVSRELVALNEFLLGYLSGDNV
jgi:hypothetical protein